MNFVIASIFCQDLGPFPFSHLWEPQSLSFLERHPPYGDSTWSTQKAGISSMCLFSGVSILQRHPLREELTVPMFKMKQSIQWCTSIKDLPEMKPFYAPKRHVPDFFQFWCTFSLFFFPLRIIPVKFIKHHHHSRGKVKMLMHPFCLQDAFRYVPFICGALEIGNKSWLLQKLQPQSKLLGH